MQEIHHFKERLAKAGIKNTKHRNAVLEVLQGADQPLSAEEVFLKLKENQVSIWLSTVYRTLETLNEKKILIKSNVMDDGTARYELHHHEHQHHVICVGCHKMMPIGDCPFEVFEKSLKKQTDFDIIGHKFEIYGYCRACK